MTVTSETAKISYAGDDSQTVFPIPFPFINDEDILATFVSAAGSETTWVLNTNYTLTGAGETSGTLTAVAALETNSILIISRDVPITQETNYVENDKFPAKVHEQGLDKLTMIMQMFNETLERALRLSIGDAENVNVLLPSPTSSNLLGWNSGANALINYAFDAVGTINDANAVPYTAPGTGAIQRYVSDELNEIAVNVKRYGATGDGATDDTTAIQAAINYAESIGLNVYFPAGIYRTTTTLLVDSYGVKLIGSNNGPSDFNADMKDAVDADITWPPASSPTTIEITNTLCAAIYADHTGGPAIRIKANRCGVKSLLIVSSAARWNSLTPTGDYGILVEGTEGVAGQAGRTTFTTLENVVVEMQPDHGVAMVGAVWYSRVIQCRFQKNQGCGLVLDNGTLTGWTSDFERPSLVDIDLSVLSYNYGEGLRIGSDDLNNWGFRNTITNCEISSNAIDAGVRRQPYQVWARSENTIIDYCAFVCSENTTIDITNITQANPAVVTTDGNHEYENGDTVGVELVGGMVEILNQSAVIANKTDTTFELTGIDSTLYTAYTSGGVASKQHDIGAVYMSGRSIGMRNNRIFRSVSPAIYVNGYAISEGDAQNRSSIGVHVDELWISQHNAFKLNPAVQVNTAVNGDGDPVVERIEVNTRHYRDITILSNRIARNGHKVSAILTDNFSINDTTTFTDVTGMAIEGFDNEYVLFRCVLFFVGQTGSADDLRVKFDVPGGGLRWGPANGLRVNDSLNIVEAPQTVTNGYEVLGTSASNRVIELTGAWNINGLGGALQLQVAQNNAVAQDLTILEKSYIEATVFRR